jgi:hypothetical protein
MLMTKLRGRVGVFSALVAMATANVAPAAVSFVPSYSDGAGEGFNDPTLGASRKAAFEHALGIWGSLITNTYAGETVVVNAQFNPLGGSAGSAPLGSAGAAGLHQNFGSPIGHPSYITGTWFGSALANHVSGSDQGGATVEINATFNTDVDNSTVLGETNWYYGTNASPGSHIDFVSVALHEVGHGLDFSASITNTGAHLNTQPRMYSRFLELGDGTDLWNMGSDSQRLAAATSNDVFWNGAAGIAANGGTRPRVYAPNPYQQGSTLSHLDETVFTNELMSPAYSGPDHTVGALALGMLADIGWTPIPEPAMAGVLIMGSLFLARRRRA